MTATTPTKRIGITGPTKVRVKRHVRRGFGVMVLLGVAAFVASVSAFAIATVLA
ncbi:MAG: hypothetical protein ACR2P0_05030 [Acidimicrobiales bacterium]